MSANVPAQDAPQSRPMVGLFTPEGSDFSAIALGWSVLWSRTIKHACSTRLGEPQSLLATRFGFAVKGLRDRRRPTSFTEKQNFYFELAALSSDLEELANMNGASGFDRLFVALNAAEFTSSGG